MKGMRLARTQLEVAYLHTKLSKLTNFELAVSAMSDWIGFSREKTKDLIMYCTGVEYPAIAAAHIYYSLGFTYRDLTKLLHVSQPTVSNYLNRNTPTVLMQPSMTPFRTSDWEHIRKKLDEKKKEFDKSFSLHAKNSIF